MWTWVAEDRAEADRSSPRSSPRCCGATRTSFARRSASGPPEHCAELLARYAEAGCERVYVWPLGDEPRQLEAIAGVAAG